MLGLGHLWILRSKNNQALHDLFTKTYIIRKNEPIEQESKKIIGLLIICLFLGNLNASFARLFIKSYQVPTSAMEDTILTGDFIVVDNLAYGMNTSLWIGIPYTDIGFFISMEAINEFKPPKQNDIVVFHYPLDPALHYIKRCIASGGQKLEIKDKQIYVDEILLPDPKTVKYLDPHIMKRAEGKYSFPTINRNEFGSRDNFGPIIISDSCFFMIGDSRDNSSDSRQWGVVPQENILGKAGIIYMSFDQHVSWLDIGNKIRWSRLGQILE